MRRALLLLLGVPLLTAVGCRHKPAPRLPVAAQAPVPLEAAPEPANPPLVATAPTQPVPVPSVTVPPRKVKRKKKLPAPAPAPVLQAAAAPAPVLLGSLTTGDNPDAAPRARDLLAANERRLAGLAADVVAGNHDPVTRARNFDRDATQALTTGDAEGALTLATKAKLLLDDLTK